MVVKDIDHSRCIKCLRCYNFCPMDVFIIMNGNIKIKYEEDCQSCYLCVYECPSNAIKVDPGRPVELSNIYDQHIF